MRPKHLMYAAGLVLVGYAMANKIAMIPVVNKIPQL